MSDVNDKLFKCNGKAAELVMLVIEMGLALKKNMGLSTLLKLRSFINGEYETEEQKRRRRCEYYFSSGTNRVI